MAVPEPEALVALTFGEQAQAHRLVEQLENELRRGGMGDAKLTPVHAVVGLCLAQVHQQAMTEPAHRQSWPAGPVPKQLRGRRIAQQVKRLPSQRQQRTAAEELHLMEREDGALRQNQP